MAARRSLGEGGPLRLASQSVHVPQWQRERVESAFSGRSSRPMHTKWIGMILTENRCTPRIKSGAGFFGIMLSGRRGVARTPGLTVRNRVLFHLSYATSFVVIGACSTIRTCVTALMRRGLCPLSYASELAARRGFDPLSSVRQTDCHASSITGLGSCLHRLASRSCGAVKAGRPPEIRTPTSGIKNPALCR